MPKAGRGSAGSSPGDRRKPFLDANVLFTAAHNPGGKCAFVIELGRRGCWSVLTCTLAVEEARRNLAVKFPDSVQRLTALLKSIEVLATVGGRDCPVALPPKDRPILVTALSAKCTHLLTGDRRHFGKLMNRPDLTAWIVIQTVTEFLAGL
jgi:hypothetical protein